MIDMDTLYRFLLNRLLWVSIAIIGILILRPFLKRLPRIGMYIIWIALIVRILCPVSVQGIYHWFTDTEQKLVQVQNDILYGGIVNQYRLSPAQKKSFNEHDIAQAEQPEVKANTEKPDKQATLSLSGQEKETDIVTLLTTIAESKPFRNVFLFLWAGGLLFCLLYLFCSIYNDRRFFANATHIEKNIYEHPHVQTPFVQGIFRPCIFLPPNIAEENRELLLIHEHMHIRRQDNKMKPLAFIAFATQWFNPLCWLAYQLMCNDMEISCDEAVIRHFNKQQRKRYSYLLLTLANKQKELYNPNTAFGADVIKERIYNVMKYKKTNRIVVTVLIAATLLCSCGILSTPSSSDKTHKNTSNSQDGVYVEQMLGAPNMSSSDGKLNYEFHCIVLNTNGKLSWFGQGYQSGKTIADSYVVSTLKDQKWEEAKTAVWSDTLIKKYKGKHMLIQNGWYSTDGLLYLVLEEDSMSHLTYYQDQEKYDGKYYPIHTYLLKIDEKKNTIKEISIPNEKRTDNGQAVMRNAYIPLANGNYVVANTAFGGEFCKIYDGKTDTASISPTKYPFTSTAVHAGDNFFCWTSYDDTKKLLNIYVCDESGQYYKMDYEVDYDINNPPTKGLPFMLGAYEDEIILIDKKGIWKAEYGEESFEQVANTENDNLYNLALDDFYFPGDRIYVANENNYYIFLQRDNDFRQNEYQVCLYTKSGK